MITSFCMVTASAGTPAPVLDKLNEILNAVLAEPEFRKQMLERNILPRPGTRQEAAAFVRQQTAKWAPITKSLNISFDWSKFQKVLSNKTAVVSGAAAGIGLAMAERFVKEGMKVALADIN